MLREAARGTDGQTYPRGDEWRAGQVSAEGARYGERHDYSTNKVIDDRELGNEGLTTGSPESGSSGSPENGSSLII